MQPVLVFMMVAGAMSLSEPALAQDVNSRAATPDEPRISAGRDLNSALGGQARNIYSQKLSGHRMMHFGKKQLHLEAPDLVTQNNQASEMYPLAAGAGSAAQALQRKQQQAYPYALLAQTITDDELKSILRRQHLMDIVSNLLEMSRAKECEEQPGQRKQKRPSETQQQVSPMRRLLQDNSEPLNFDFNSRRPMAEDGEEFFDLDRHRANEARMAQQGRSSNLVEAKTNNDEQVGEQQGQENGSINLESRSVPMQFGPDMPSSTKALISSILYGRQAGQRNTPPPNYAKKFDPNRMKFMHFG